jgi:predicted RNA-binding Zn-ribbon protein involved in translation (DUF1610 family)
MEPRICQPLFGRWCQPRFRHQSFTRVRAYTRTGLGSRSVRHRAGMCLTSKCPPDGGRYNGVLILSFHATSWIRRRTSASSFGNFLRGSARNVQNRTVLRPALRQSCGMKNNELTRAQMAAVPCPTCGVAIGKRCILYSGGLRSQPHLVRKLAAVDALEKK